MSGVIMLTKDDNGNVTMGLGMPPEEAMGMLIEAAMRLASEYNLTQCDCPPGTHDAIPDLPRVGGFDQVVNENSSVIAPGNDFSGLAASLRRATELAEKKEDQS
jgi:hypothetical protein